MSRRTVANFISDWTQVARRRLTKFGIEVPAGMSDDFVRYAYVGLVRRRGGRPRPREVAISDEFTFPEDCEPGLRIIQQKLENGDDLAPHLSKRIEKLVSDGLFEDWGIVHFHLGTKMETEGRFIERTPPLLYAFLTNTKAYLLDVLPHGHWADTRLLEILHANWPEVIARHRMPAHPQAEQFRPTSQGFQKARESGIMALVTLSDGAVYVPPGGGYSTAGVPNASVDGDERFTQHLAVLQQRAEERLETLRAEARMAGVVLPDEPVDLRFDLDDEDNEWIVCDAVSFGWKLAPE